MTAGSRCLMYSPLWKVSYLLVQLEMSMLTDVLPLILWMPLIMFMFGSLPFEVFVICNEVCHLFFNNGSTYLNWHDLIVLWWFFKH